MDKEIYKNAEGYIDKTAGQAIEREQHREKKEPENVSNFRRAIKLLCQICRVRVQGKIVIIDEKGRRW